MTIEVTAPDGSIAQFPDGTSEAVITNAMKAQFGPAAPSAGPSAPAFQVRPETQGPDNNLLETGKDIGRVALGGLTRGAMIVPDVANLARSGLNAGLDYLMPPTAEQRVAKESMPKPIGSQDAVNAVERVTGINTSPEGATTTTGKTVAPYVKTASEFVPAAVATGGGAIVGGVIPGIASEAAGQLTKGKWYEPLARIAGGFFAAPIATRAATPAPASAERTAMVNTLRGEGVDSITAGQATGSAPIRWAESALGDIGGGRASAIAERGKEQYTAAALRRVGENAERATPEVLDRALTRIGQQFDDLAARNVMGVDARLGQDLQAVQQQYNMLANPMQREVLHNALADVVDVIRQHGGVVPGQVYQTMRSRLNAAGRGSADSDAQLSQAMFGVMNALDDSMGRTLARTGNMADYRAWQEARREYRNFLPLERAATSAGADAAEGLLSPQAMRNAVVNQDRRAYARGQGDYADLARSGAGVLTTPPNSGTPARTYMQNLLPTLLSGSALGGVAAGGPGAAVGAAAALSPILLSRLMMSRPVQAYLANQAALASGRSQALRGAGEAAASLRE